MENEENEYYKIMILHALGDTLGFKNGDWEFNYHDKEKLEVLDYVNEMIYEFIDLGGINGIDISNWKVSDDTFLHIAVAKGLTHKDKIIKYTKKYLQEETESMLKDKTNRYIGITTEKYIKKFTKDYDARNAKYDYMGGGNGGAMKALIIGACFKNDLKELIKTSITISQLTHNNAFGYLAGMTSALFTSLALQKIEIKKWVSILLKELNSQEVKNFLSLENLEQIYDHQTYIKYWLKYYDTKFDKNGEPIKNRSFANPMHRIRYYHDNFFKDTLSQQIGSSGYLCMIMAYDALLDCDGKWEKLVVYSILHSGDSDTIGAIAGGLYGAFYGFGDVPINLLKNIERKKEIKNICDELQKIY